MKAENINRRKFARIMGVGTAAIAVFSNLPEAVANALPGSGGVTIFDEDELLNGFNNLPPSAKPWTFYMWLDGNVSRRGITSDLEALKRIGIGGVLVMNLGLPPNEEILPGPVRFMTEEWKQLVQHTISEANRLGLQVNMNNDDGWNSGGPWITPELGMQKLTWSETTVKGPVTFKNQLERGDVTLDHYRDVKVIAFPKKQAQPVAQPVETSVQKTPVCFILNDFGKTVTAQSIQLSNSKIKPGYVGPVSGKLEVSDDGKTYRLVRDFETGWLSFTAPKTTVIRVGKVSGRYFRLVLPDDSINPEDVQFRLLPEALIDHWQLKAGFTYIREHGGGSPMYALPVNYPVPMTGSFPLAAEVIDLTDKIDGNGLLQWKVPAGEWTVLRVGHTPTGMKNGYATPEGKGLDSDKYNRKALEVHLSGMVDHVLEGAGDLVGKGIAMLHTDSWESGAANWTSALPAEFKNRRGYDMTPWLPVVAGGRVLGSVEESERFLWDFRRTIADIFVDHHLKYFRELAHKRGLPFSSESSGRQQFLYDPITFQVSSDLPMGEFWNTPQERRPRPDCKGAASAAHVANRQIAGAESFTQNQKNAGTWLESPYSLKALGDSAFCSGINRFYFHRTVAQPNPDQKPGMTWPKVGINFDTSQTWWSSGSAWIEYLTRCQYLLQQGRFVADVAVMTDEGAPSSLTRLLHKSVAENDPYDTSTVTESVLRRYNMMPYLPNKGYDYDFLNAGTVYQLSVKDGSLMLPHGMGYKILVLAPGKRMTLGVARKIRELVHAGATIVGDKPEMSPSLGDFKNGDAELQKIAAELWGNDADVPAGRRIGKGRVFSGNATQAALDSLSILPDFEYAGKDGSGKTDLDIDFIHRQTADADIYFVSNQENQTVHIEALFRVKDKTPEYWFPDTGKVVMWAGAKSDDERIRIPLTLDPSGSVFLVFRKRNSADIPKITASPFARPTTIQEIGEGWTVFFDPAAGGPGIVQMKDLKSWTELTEPGVKYYSGTAKYAKQIDLSRKLFIAKSTLYLDLGEVKEIARVKLNGVDLGVLWKPPYRVDISKAAKKGKNLLEVEITNLWPNRLIGDAGLPRDKKIASVNWNPYQANSPLLLSGLLGPVTIQKEELNKISYT